MRIRRELQKYIYLNNNELLQIFKNGSRGESHYNDFIKLLKEELKSQDILNDVSLELFKNGTQGEKAFIGFMYNVREEIVIPAKSLSIEELEILNDEIKKEFGSEFGRKFFS